MDHRRLSGVLALALLLGCSEKAGPDSRVSARSIAPSPRPEPAHYLLPEATGLLRGTAESFPIVAFFSNLVPSPPPCWTRLRAAIEVAYHVELVDGGSYIVIEGALPRSEVERCVRGLEPVSISVEPDGELVAFDAGPLGTAYAAWRGAVIIAGTRAHVVKAAMPNGPGPTRMWRARLATLPPGPMAIWRSDALLANILGVPTTSYVLAFETLQKTPEPFFAGRLIIEYPTSADAADAARRISAGQLAPAIAAPPELVESFRRMKVTRLDHRVEAAFDLDTFAGLDLGILQAWVANLTAPP